MSGQLSRVFHTARYLRLQQVASRIRLRARSAFPDRSGSGIDEEPEFPGCRWSEGRDPLPPAIDGVRADDLMRGVFSFLNTPHEIGFPPDWDDECPSRLWQYNLHYFDWLWLLDFEMARGVVLDWIARYPDRGGRVGWEPYPTSVRAMNWCAYFFGRRHSETLADGSLCQVLWRSLHQQCEWLSRRLETHLLNNHYLENAAALTLVGSCFEGHDARRWRDRGRRILSAQIAEQILPDGLHFELSPMYHARILYVLSLLAEMEPALADSLAEPMYRMAHALERLCHPDGDIALLGDSALGICHNPERLLAYVGRNARSPCIGAPSYGCFALLDAGYYGWRDSDRTYLIADFGKIGPDHNPGHGHADAFSFELSVRGSRVITDSGVYDYEASHTRQYCRSTAAHSTVEIEGQDQCELWGAFRVARRGSPRHVVWQPGSSGFALEGWHDGYARLRGRPVHARLMQWDAAVGLTVRDTIRANRPVRCVSRLHLHPACRIVESYGRSVRVAYASGEFVVEANGEIAIEDSQYCTRFYQTQSRSCLCLAGCGNPIELKYRIRV